MSRRFTELAWADTPRGEISLRRRIDPLLRREVHEVRLGEEFLMSSLFTTAEEELARLALAAVDGADLAVVVGGLGLGHTARAALDEPRVGRVDVVDVFAEVVDWHRRGLVPLGAGLTADPRCAFVVADFFALVDGARGLGTAATGGLDAVLLDIDHTPRHLLHPDHARAYTPHGWRRLAAHLRPGGVLGMWADGAPDDAVTGELRAAFAAAEAHVVTFPNPFTGQDAASTVYVATAEREPQSV